MGDTLESTTTEVTTTTATTTTTEEKINKCYFSSVVKLALSISFISQRFTENFSFSVVKGTIGDLLWLSTQKVNTKSWPVSNGMKTRTLSFPALSTGRINGMLLAAVTRDGKSADWMVISLNDWDLCPSIIFPPRAIRWTGKYTYVSILPMKLIISDADGQLGRSRRFRKFLCRTMNMLNVNLALPTVSSILLIDKSLL